MLVLLGDNATWPVPIDDVYRRHRERRPRGLRRQHASPPTTSAMLTLDRPADAYEPMRVAGTDERSTLGTRATLMRIIGWGTNQRGRRRLSSALLGGRRADASRTRSATRPTASFDANLMVCAADAPGTAAGRVARHLPGRLRRAAAGRPTTTGSTRRSASCRAAPDARIRTFPGVYARIGADPLNAWVTRPHAARAASTSTTRAVATQPVTLFSTSTHPAPADLHRLQVGLRRRRPVRRRERRAHRRDLPRCGRARDRARGLRGPAATARASTAPSTSQPPPATGGGARRRHDDTSRRTRLRPRPEADSPPSPAAAGAPGDAQVAEAPRARARAASTSGSASIAPRPPARRSLTVLLKGKKIGSARVRVSARRDPATARSSSPRRACAGSGGPSASRCRCGSRWPAGPRARR